MIHIVNTVNRRRSFMNNMRLARMAADMLQAKEKPQVRTDEDEEVIDNFLDAMRPTR